MSQLPSLTTEERLQVVKQCVETKNAPPYIHEGFITVFPQQQQALFNTIARALISLFTFLTLDTELADAGNI